MRLLAIDTATEACSVALLTEGSVIGISREPGRGHAEQILGMVDAILAQGGAALGQLDGIAASVGPGAFTGVRLSVSVAQGLAFGAGLPVIGITTLEALALQAASVAGVPRTTAPDFQVLACLDARMGEVYWGCFGADAARGVAPRGSPGVGLPGSVHVPFRTPYDGIGRGFAAYPSLASLPGLHLAAGAVTALPDARDMARLAAYRFAAGEGADPASLLPLYLRNNVALTEAERAAARTAAPTVMEVSQSRTVIVGLDNHGTGPK